MPLHKSFLSVVLPDGTFTFAKRSLGWGIPSATRLVTHKELAAAEELMQKALETPIEVAEEEKEEKEEKEESAPTEETTGAEE